MHKLKASEIRAAILIIRELQKVKRPLAIKELPIVVGRSYPQVKPMLDRLLHARILERKDFRSGVELGDKYRQYLDRWVKDYA